MISIPPFISLGITSDVAFFVGGGPLGCGLGTEIAVILPALALCRRRRFARR